MSRPKTGSSRDSNLSIQDGQAPSPLKSASSRVVAEAESIHQDYYAKFPEQGYCQVIINPKLAKARKYYSSWLRA